MASIFTQSGAAARKFRYEVPTGNVGVNVGVAAPMAYFPFSGWGESFFGVLHAQGNDVVHGTAAEFPAAETAQMFGTEMAVA